MTLAMSAFEPTLPISGEASQHRAMRTRLSICTRKARYASERDASVAASNATIPLRPYRCDRCRHYHLTSRTKGKRVLRPPAPDPQ